MHHLSKKTFLFRFLLCFLVFTLAVTPLFDVIAAAMGFGTEAASEENQTTNETFAISSKTIAAEFPLKTPVITLDQLHPEENEFSLEITNDSSETRKTIEELELTNTFPESSLYTEDDVKAIARTIYGEARDSEPKELAAVAWCILNRVDAGFAGSIQDVVTMKGAFSGYKEDNPCGGINEWIARDVLNRWAREKNGETDVGRVLPNDYFFFMGKDGKNCYTKECHTGEEWDWSLPDPYDDSGILFLGNSLTEGLATAPNSKASFLCETGISLDALNKKVVSEIGNHQFHTAVICMGTNELGGYSKDRFIGAYKELIANLRAANPDARIVIQTIPPVSRHQDGKGVRFNNENVKLYNEYVLEVCEEEQVSYIDNGKFFGDILDSEWTPEGIHMYSNVYWKWYDFILEHLV